MSTNTHYNKNHCWQYEIRKQALESDLKEVGLTHLEMSSLRVPDFKFFHVTRKDKKMCDRIKAFIIRYEWLGKMPHRPTHRFIATYKGHLAGVIVMATPNAFSHLLGKDHYDKEKLISRGACVSWSPKNLASSLMMFSIRWMVENTPYRYFSAYSDIQAKELGIIYQACNFIYLGQEFGARFKYYDPSGPNKGWFNDRNFRKVTSYKKYALNLGIEWRDNWNKRDKIYWDKIPKDIASELKQALKDQKDRCQVLKIPRKHKYVYILGRSKKETKELVKLFKEKNPDKQGLAYPKIRGRMDENW